MTCFYTYMAFSQYFLIWYANIPEETIFYRHRMAGSWLDISLALPFLRFFIPFFILLSRPAKRNLKVIGVMAVWSLVVESIWICTGSSCRTSIRTVRSFTGWIWRPWAATVSICGLVFWSRFRAHKMVPVGDLAAGTEPAF